MQTDRVTTSMTTAAVVLAAGAGSRFAGPQHKLRTRLADGRTLAEHAVAAARASAIGPVVVVVGATPLELPDEIAGDVEQVTNPHWATGQASSLQTAVAAARRLGVDAIVVGLADQPGIPAEAWRRVAASTSPIAVATYADSGDAPRNPVRLHRDVWPRLPTDGDHGARQLIRWHPELVERIPCPGSAADVDTIADLRRLRHQRHLEDADSWPNNSSTNSP